MFGVEYCDSKKAFGGDARNLRPDCVCALARGAAPGTAPGGGAPKVTLNWQVKNVALNAVGLECREYCARPGVTCTAPSGNNVNQCVQNTPNNLCPSYNVVR